MPSTRKKILIIDDDVLLLKSLASFIEMSGFNVETARNAKEALKKLEQGFPDLIIIDAIMPEYNGFELTKAIRNLEEGKRTPIIMISGMKTNTDKMNALASGANEFIGKPIKPEELVKRIRHYCWGE